MRCRWVVALCLVCRAAPATPLEVAPAPSRSDTSTARFEPAQRGRAAGTDSVDAAAARRAPGPPAATGSVGGRTFGWSDLLREEERFDFAPGAARRPLAHPFVQFGSEVVRTGDSLLVRNRDYGIDYGRGVLFLLSQPAASTAVQVRYLYLPGPRRRSFRAAEFVSREQALSKVGADPAPIAAAPPAAEAQRGRDVAPPTTLQLSGSNSIGVAFGRNREAKLDQSLRVEAAGEIGEGLHVDAVLADDNMPVTAEGTTEELNDLSRVFIEMQGPVVGGVLGDYSLRRTPGELVDVQRELRGGELRLRGGGQALSVGAGIAKGDLVTISLRGSEGRQGPYELLSARRVGFSTLVPGSERVYLDGELLRRGENQDYVVDYDRGELGFTSRRRITADSEIGVDFQVSGAGYRRQTRDVALDGHVGKLRVRGLLFSEGDERDRPLDDPFGPEDIAALAAAGDRAAIAPGIRAVGPGRGSYRYLDTDSTIVLYDPVQGYLDVDFFEAGPGRGAYEDSLDVLSGRRIFRHVGSERGHFAIGRQLAPPGWLRLASTSVDAVPWGGARLKAEMSVSSFDANQFSSRDDGDNVGEALEVRLDAGRPALARSGGAGLELHFSQLSARFHPPGRARPPFYYKDWNAESDSLVGTERIAESTVGWGLGGERPWLRFDANVGRLDRGADLVTDRAQVDLALGRAPDRGLDLRVQALDTERPELGTDAGRTRRFFRTGTRYRLGRFVPAVQVEGDEFVRAERDSLARPSYRYLDVGCRLGLLETGRTTVGLALQQRDTDARRSAAERAADLGTWQPERRNATYSLDATTRPTASFTADLGLSRRTNEPRGPQGGAATRSDLARAALAWIPRTHPARAEWRYELSEEAVRTLQEVLVLSPDGNGDYDAEGRPVGKDLGTYDKVIRYAAAAEPVRQAETSLRLELGGTSGLTGGAADSTAGWLRRDVSLVQVLALAQQTQSDRLGDLLQVRPGVLHSPAALFGNFKARQEWSFLGSSTRAALKLFLDWEEGLDARLTDNAVRDRDRSATLRYEQSGARHWTCGGELGLGWRERRGRLDAAIVGRPGSGTYDVRFARLLGRAGYRLSASERLGIDFEWGEQSDALSTTQQHLLTVTPSATLAPARNLRLLATLAATRVLESKPLLVVAPYFFDPPGTKATASFLGSYRLGRALQFNVNYSGVRGSDGRFTYDFKAETRAIF